MRSQDLGTMYVNLGECASVGFWKQIIYQLYNLFFLMGKRRNILSHLGAAKSIHNTGDIQKGPNGKNKKAEHIPAQNNPTRPHLHLNQGKKSIKESGLSAINKYTQDQKLQKKKSCFILIIDKSTLLKTRLFLSRQTV